MSSVSNSIAAFRGMGLTCDGHIYGKMRSEQLGGFKVTGMPGVYGRVVQGARSPSLSQLLTEMSCGTNLASKLSVGKLFRLELPCH